MSTKRVLNGINILYSSCSISYRHLSRHKGLPEMAERKSLRKMKSRGVRRSLENLDQDELYERVFAGIKSSPQFHMQRFPTCRAFVASFTRNEEDDHRTQELVKSIACELAHRE